MVNVAPVMETPSMNIEPQIVNQTPIMEEQETSAMKDEISSQPQANEKINNNGIFTSDGAQPFDISSMFTNNK